MPTVNIVKDNVTKEIEALTLKEVYKKLNINSTTVIATKDNELITESNKLQSKDKIKIIPVISGG